MLSKSSMRITLHLSGWKLKATTYLTNPVIVICRSVILSGLPGMSDLTYTFGSSANSLTPHLTVFGQSFINITKKSGPRTLPLTTTHWCRPAKNALIQFKVLLHMPYDCNFTRRCRWGTLSNAFLKSI